MNAIGCGQQEGKNLGRHNAKQEREGKRSQVKSRQKVEHSRVRYFGNQVVQDSMDDGEDLNDHSRVRPFFCRQGLPTPDATLVVDHHSERMWNLSSFPKTSLTNRWSDGDFSSRLTYLTLQLPQAVLLSSLHNIHLPFGLQIKKSFY